LKAYIFVQPSVLRTPKALTASPSAEALGYFLSVRFADEENTFEAKLSPAEFLKAPPDPVATALGSDTMPFSSSEIDARHYRRSGQCSLDYSFGSS
jgi:hypothetical protein